MKVNFDSLVFASNLLGFDFMARECNDKVFVATTSSSVLVDAFCSRWTLFLACDICFCLNISRQITCSFVKSGNDHTRDIPI